MVAVKAEVPSAKRSKVSDILHSNSAIMPRRAKQEPVDSDEEDDRETLLERERASRSLATPSPRRGSSPEMLRSVQRRGRSVPSVPQPPLVRHSRAPRETASRSLEPLPWKAYGVCRKPLLPGQPLYRNYLNQHAECGHSKRTERDHFKNPELQQVLIVLVFIL